MLKEVKIFFENLTHFRQLLSEGVAENSVVDAIHQHKIVYIYYAGDDTIMKGYRTIKPMVLGHTVSKKARENGEDYLLLRAWEIAGNSDSRKKYPDEKGRYQYGWRLFRVDKITSFLPTGKIFSVERNKFPMPDAYNPDDSQMQNIIAAVQIVDNAPKTSKQGEITMQKLKEPPSGFDGQKDKFQYFSKVGKTQRNATADEIQHLWDIAGKIKKKSREKLIVVTDEHGDLVLKDVSQQDKLPPEAIVGNLKSLYIDLVKPNENINTSFFKKVQNDTINNMNKDNLTKEKKGIDFENLSFMKESKNKSSDKELF
jgi:hypothetical protein